MIQTLLLLLLTVWCVWSTKTYVPGNEEDEKAYLEMISKEPGVITLPSGLRYKVLEKGEGDSYPLPSSMCSCHYHGSLINGNVFDSSVQRGIPTTFAPNQVIKGWTEAMQLMVEGDKWELYIPYQLAYGASGRAPKIPGKATLVFTLEMILINGGKKPKKEL